MLIQWGFPHSAAGFLVQVCWAHWMGVRGNASSVRSFVIHLEIADRELSRMAHVLFGSLGNFEAMRVEISVWAL